jgi:hypothetical protein
LVCGAVAGEAKRPEDESDGESDKKSAQAVIQSCVMEAQVFAQDRQHEAGEEAEITGGEKYAGLPSEVSFFEVHGRFSFSVSVSEAEPGKQGHLDDDEDESDCEQVPTPDVVPEKAVFKEDDGKAGGDYAGNAGGAATVLKKALVDESAQDGNSAQDGMSHDSLSKWKIWSVGQAKIRAKVSANSRLGT